MKAAIVEKPGSLVVKDVPIPRMGEYGALCRLLFGSTCSGTDQHLIEDKMPWKIEYPMVLGHESIGRVIEVGPKVRHLRLGDLVTRVGMPSAPEIGLHVSWGGFCEFGIAIDHRAMREDGHPREMWAASRINQTIPPSAEPAACTMIITWRETLSYSRRVGVRAGSRVLVLGSGGTGLAFITHCRNLGAQTIACTGNRSRESTARAAGATHFFAYDDPEMASTICRHCSEFDFVIDSVGKSGQLDRVVSLLKHGGTVAIYGLDDFASTASDAHRAAGAFTVYEGGYDEEETHDEVILRMINGTLDARIWLDLDHPFELKDIAAAMTAIRQRQVIKALVRLSDER